MAARILDGKATAKAVREELAVRIAQLIAAARAPRLVVLLVGDNLASQVYVRNKERAALKIGIAAETRRFPATIGQAALEAEVASLAADVDVDGVLVQLPLPGGLDEERVVRLLPPEKDVDGLHPANVGDLARGVPRFVPCTPAGIVELLVRHGIRIPGKHVVIIGRSSLVGRPLASLLLRKGERGDATVTLCHSRTRDVAEIVHGGDIVVAAVGHPGTVTADMVRAGAVVVDVGINRVAKAGGAGGETLVGDVEFDSVAEKASWITPVPGGVGPMTVAMLLANTVQAAENHGRVG
jgi:methylenetetrahydrofolate dehydrogenase (NADP+)/methenyltetrahydrofolate cyclohydrolase